MKAAHFYAKADHFCNDHHLSVMKHPPYGLTIKSTYL
jgi:hypothetical protein